MRTMCKSTLAVLVVAFAVSAVGAASASASLPEFSTETNAILGTPGESEIYTEVGDQWAYSGGSTSSFVASVSSKTAVKNVSLKFNGGTRGCSTKRYGILEWTGLSGRLGYINKEKKEVGLLLGHTPLSTKLDECEREWGADGTYTQSGDFIGKITPVNTKTSKFTLTFSSSYFKQSPAKLEGESEAHPLIFGTYGCGLFEGEEFCAGSGELFAIKSTVTLNTEKEMEIKA